MGLRWGLGRRGGGGGGGGGKGGRGGRKGGRRSVFLFYFFVSVFVEGFDVVEVGSTRKTVLLYSYAHRKEESRTAYYPNQGR